MELSELGFSPMVGNELGVGANFISDLMCVLNTPIGRELGERYLKSRGLNPSLIRGKWLVSGSDVSPFMRFKDKYPPQIFTDSVYIPIYDIGDASGETLLGFDVRYIGSVSGRLRYHKFRSDNRSPLIYGLHDALDSRHIFVTEGAADAEAIRVCGFAAISPLTALKTPRFLQFLYALGSKVYLAYDNDKDGKSATEKLIMGVIGDVSARERIKAVSYSGKDPNWALQNLGVTHLRNELWGQLVW